MSCKWCAMGQCWGCKQNPQQGGKGQKRAGAFGGPGGKRGNFGNDSNESMMAGMMMALMANMSGGGGGGFRGNNKEWKQPKRQAPQVEQPWKGALQKALKADGKGAATFESEEVDKAAKKWTAVVTVDGEQVEGRGKGKAGAESSAARNALRQLYPSEHAELAAALAASKVSNGPAQDSRARLHHGTQLFVRRQFDRNMTPEDIKYEAAKSGASLTATVTLPEGLEGPYVGQPSADKLKAEESAADAALAACENVFDELQRDATQKKEAQRQEKEAQRQAKFDEEGGEKAGAKKPMVGFAKLGGGGVKKEAAQKKPMVGFAKLGGGVAKNETVQKKPLRLSITLNK